MKQIDNTQTDERTKRMDQFLSLQLAGQDPIIIDNQDEEIIHLICGFSKIVENNEYYISIEIATLGRSIEIIYFIKNDEDLKKKTSKDFLQFENFDLLSDGDMLLISASQSKNSERIEGKGLKVIAKGLD